MRISRQLDVCGIGVVVSLLLSPALVLAEKADLVLRSASVYTVDASRSWAEAVAVSGNKIVFVGRDHDVAAYIGEDTKVIDLAGRTAIPGIVDSHCHPDSQAARLVRWHELSPEHVTARLALAEILYGREQLAEAAEQYRRVLELDPGHEGARRSLEFVTAGDGG